MAFGHPLPPVPAIRTGVFSAVRSRWLLAWIVVGFLATMAVVLIPEVLWDLQPSEEGLAILFYLPIIGWMALVVIRHRIDLRAPLRWPRLGAFWLVVGGLFALQLLFSLATVTLTQIVAPWLGEGQEQVGRGSLVLSLVALVVLPPLVEEFLFRFLLLERLAVKWSIRVSVVVCAVAFGILHADPVGAGAFGVVTALLYLRTGSLWPAILIHAANNLLAVVVTRSLDPTDEVEQTTVEALVTAGVLLAITVPFLVWFIVANWPPKDAATPYQRHELMSTGLPVRHVASVAWSGAPGVLLLLTVTSSQLVLGIPGMATPVAVLPLDRVRAVYPTAIPGDEMVVIHLWDGSWSTLYVPLAGARRNQQLVRVIGERADLARTPALR